MMTCVEKLCYQFFSRLQLFLFSSHSVWKLFLHNSCKESSQGSCNFWWCCGGNRGCPLTERLRVQFQLPPSGEKKNLGCFARRCQRASIRLVKEQKISLFLEHGGCEMAGKASLNRVVLGSNPVSAILSLLVFAVTGCRKYAPYL